MLTSEDVLDITELFYRSTVPVHPNGWVDTTNIASRKHSVQVYPFMSLWQLDVSLKKALELFRSIGTQIEMYELENRNQVSPVLGNARAV